MQWHLGKGKNNDLYCIASAVLKDVSCKLRLQAKLASRERGGVGTRTEELGVEPEEFSDP